MDAHYLKIQNYSQTWSLAFVYFYLISFNKKKTAITIIHEITTKIKDNAQETSLTRC